MSEPDDLYELLKASPYGLTMYQGKCRSGKSTFLTWQMREAFKKKLYTHGIIFSTSNYVNHEWDWAKKYPNIRIVDIESPDQLMSTTFKFVMAMKKYIKDGNTPLSCVLIYDDCVGILKTKTEQFENLIVTARHPHCAVFVTSQHYKKMPPLMRQNSEAMYFFRPPSKIARKDLIEEVDIGIDDDDYLKLIFETFIQDHACARVDPNVNSRKVDDIITCWKAPPPPKKKKERSTDS